MAASGLVSLRKIFLPTKFSYPTFRGSGPRSSTRSIPSARPRPAQLNRLPINKTGGTGRKILWGGRNHALTSFSAKKWAVKDGDFCARHFLRGRFSQPQTGGTTHSKNRGFFPSRAKVAVVAGAGKARSRASVTVLPPSFPLSLAHSSGLRLGVVCRAERNIKRKRKGNDSLGARPTVTPP